jgi:hypothetical protein
MSEISIMKQIRLFRFGIGAKHSFSLQHRDRPPGIKGRRRSYFFDSVETLYKNRVKLVVWWGKKWGKWTRNNSLQRRVE